MQSFKLPVLYNIAADLLFACHIVIVGLLLFGWISLQLLALYSLALITTLLSEALLGYSPLTRWEFALRRRANPAVFYGKDYLSYYAYKLMPQIVLDAQIQLAARLFLLISLLALAYRLTSLL
jgi:Protein of Unknown function (DUF2784)